MSENNQSGASAKISLDKGTPDPAEARPESSSQASSSASAPESKSFPDLDSNQTRENQSPAPPDTENTERQPEPAETSAHEPENTADSPDSEEAPRMEPEYDGRFNACFNGLSKIGPLALLFALACMTWPAFLKPMTALYCPAEIKSVTALLHSIASSSWLAPTGLENGAWTAAQWPVFSWVTGLIALSPGIADSGYLFPTTTFICAFFAILGVWCLAHAAGFGYKSAFAAGLILLCCPLFAPLPTFVGPATLAAGLFLFALVFFCRGWTAEKAWISLPLAFVLTALAFLCGGWFFLATPLLASLCLLIWRGKPGRAHKLDAIFGFALMLAIIGIWLGWLMLGHVDDSYLALLFEDSLHFSWPIPLKWLAPIAIGIIGTMPWLLMILGVSWLRVLKHSGKTLSESRHANGSALVWSSLVLSLPIALWTGPFHPEAITIGCLVTILLGKASLNLGHAGNRFFSLLASLCLIVAGLLILCASFSATQPYLFSMLPALPVADIGQKLQSLSMLPIMGGLTLLGGLLALIFVRRFGAAGPLIYAILFVIILCQPARLKFVSELGEMPGTPLVTYPHIEAMVMDALAAPVKPETLPPAQAPTPAETATPPSQTSEPLPVPVETSPAPSEPAPSVSTPNQDLPPAFNMPSPPAPEQPTAPANSAPVESAPMPEPAQLPEAAPAEPVTPPVTPDPVEPAPMPEATAPAQNVTPPVQEEVAPEQPSPDSAPVPEAQPSAE